MSETTSPVSADTSRPGWRAVIEIPQWHPAKLNQLVGCHWAVRSKLKKRDWQIIALYASGYRSMATTAAGKRRVSLVITLAPRQRGGDPDSYWKSLLDALVHAGLLVDDSPKWCELGPVEYRRGSEMATTIILEDLPA